MPSAEEGIKCLGLPLCYYYLSGKLTPGAPRGGQNASCPKPKEAPPEVMMLSVTIL